MYGLNICILTCNIYRKQVSRTGPDLEVLRTWHNENRNYCSSLHWHRKVATFSGLSFELMWHLFQVQHANILLKDIFILHCIWFAYYLNYCFISVVIISLYQLVHLAFLIYLPWAQNGWGETISLKPSNSNNYNMLCI